MRPNASRALDLLVASLALALASPLLALAAILIKLESRGPVFYRQRRVGRGGEPFELWKLRTMARDAEERRTALLAASRDPEWLHVEHDPRVTRMGR